MKTKRLGIFFVFIAISAIFLISYAMADTVIKGDMDDSNSVDLNDAILTLRIAADLSYSINLNADATGDGKIGIEDTIYILQVAAGLRNNAIALPSPTSCPQFLCEYATIRTPELRGVTLSDNVLKIFSAAADSTRNRVYVSGILTPHIAVMDGATEQWIGTIDTQMTGYSYKYLYHDAAANYLYVVDTEHKELRRIDLATNAIAGPVTINGGITPACTDTKRGYIYLASGTSPYLSAYDGKTLTQVWTSDLMGSGTGDMVYDAASDVLFVLDVASQAAQRPIYRFNPETRQISSTINYSVPTSDRSRWLLRDSDNGRFIIGSYRNILILNSNGSAYKTIAVPADYEVQNMLCDQVHKRIAVLSVRKAASGEVAGVGGRMIVYNSDTAELTATIDFGKKPHQMCINSATNKIYVPNGDAGTVWQISTDSYSSATAMRLGDSLEQILAADNGTSLYMNSRLGGSYLLSLNPDSGVFERFESGTWPFPIRTDAAGEHLFILNAWDSTLSVYTLKPTRTLQATISIGLSKGTTDRLPDLAIDSTHRLAYAAYPEFGKIAVVSWEQMKNTTTITLDGFATGEAEQGPGNLQMTVNEADNLLFVFRKNERKLNIFNAAGNYSKTDVDLSALNWNKVQNGQGTDTLFFDAQKKMLFVGPFELSGTTGNPTGRTLDHGQQIFALDSARNTYWASGIEGSSRIVAVINRDTLVSKKVENLPTSIDINETSVSYFLEQTRNRLYIGLMTKAELHIFNIGVYP